MTAIEQYNALEGKKLTRSQIRKLVNLAKFEGAKEVENKLVGLLKAYPGEKGFEFSTINQVSENFEGLGIPFISDDEINEIVGETEAQGLNRTVDKDFVYNMITNRIIKQIETQGYVPWLRPHDGSKGNKTLVPFAGSPINFNTKNNYRGINAMLLLDYPYAGEIEGTNVKTGKPSMIPAVLHEQITDGRLFWMTFKQIKDKGGKLKKGSKSSEVVYYNFSYLFKGKKITEAEYKKLYFSGGCNKTSNMGKSPCVELRKFGFLKYFNVFNERDIEGLDFDEARKKLKLTSIQPQTTEQKILGADLIIKNMPKKPKLKVIHLTNRESPHYSPGSDTVTMPQKEQAPSLENWYATCFHEHIHATGHLNRLQRHIKPEYRATKWGDTRYALEELVAEIGSVFLNAESGIMLADFKNNATYIKGWASKVKKALQKDNKAIFKASSDAQKACDFILDRDKDGEPKFWKEYEKIQKEIATKGAKQAKEKSLKVEIRPASPRSKMCIVWDIAKDMIWANEKFKSIEDAKSFCKQNKLEVAKVTCSIAKVKNNTAGKIKNPVKTVSNKKKAVKNKNKTGQMALFGLNGSVPKNPTVEQALAFADKYLVGKSIYHQDIGKKIVFTKGGIKKSINGKGRVTRTRLQLVFIASDLVKKARLYSSRKDRKKRDNILSVHTLRTTTTLDGNKFEVIIQLQENKNGVIYYDHTGIKIKKQLSVPVDKSEPLSRAKLPSRSKEHNKDNKKKDNGLKGVVIQDVSQIEMPVIQNVIQNIEPVAPPVAKQVIQHKNPLVRSINHVAPPNEKFVINGDIGAFLGELEKKPVGSVACTLDAPQGSGKTRFFFQVMNEMARNYKCLFISLEEHPSSTLFQEKVKQYIEPQNQNNVDAIGELPRGKEKKILDQLIPQYDVVFIDSWNKIHEVTKLDFDNDLRKAYNGKLIFAIFQRTTNGAMRGGAKAQFDGDVIMKIVKGKDFKENEVYHDKNRYQSKDLTDLKYNIYTQAMVNVEEDYILQDEELTEPVEEIIGWNEL